MENANMVTMAGWATISDLFRYVYTAESLAHVGRGSRAYGDRTGRDLGGRTNHRTLCNGRQMGGAWGYTDSREAPRNTDLCRRCAKLAGLT